MIDLSGFLETVHVAFFCLDNKGSGYYVITVAIIFKFKISGSLFPCKILYLTAK